MSTAYFLLDAASWTWIVVITALVIGGYFFLDMLMRKGIHDAGRASGGLMNSAFSELQTLVDPAHRHVIEECDRKRSELDNAGDDPAQTS